MPKVGRDVLPPSLAKKAWAAMGRNEQAKYSPENLRYALTDNPARQGLPRKTERLTIRLCEEDKNLIAQQARVAGMSQADYLVMLAYLADKIRPGQKGKKK